MRDSYHVRSLRANSTAASEKMEHFDFSSEELKFYFKLHTYRYWDVATIVEETGVVKVTVYRWIKKMEDAGLLEMDSNLGVKQKRKLRWRRKYDEVRIRPWGICWVKPVRRRLQR